MPGAARSEPRLASRPAAIRLRLEATSRVMMSPNEDVAGGEFGKAGRGGIGGNIPDRGIAGAERDQRPTRASRASARAKLMATPPVSSCRRRARRTAIWLPSTPAACRLWANSSIALTGTPIGAGSFCVWLASACACGSFCTHGAKPWRAEHACGDDGAAAPLACPAGVRRPPHRRRRARDRGWRQPSASASASVSASLAELAAARRTRAPRPTAGLVQQLAGQDHAAHEHQRRQRRDRDGRELLRIGRHVRHGGARNHPRVGGAESSDAVARGRLAVFGQIRFQQIALRFGVALERAQLHVVLVRRHRLALELVEGRRAARRPGRRRAWRRFPASARGVSASFLIWMSRSAICALQFLDARMVAEQRGGLLGKLRAQRHALLGQPADQLRIEDVGGIRSARRT